MNKKLNMYFFGTTGTYDEYSPSYVCGKKNVPEILYFIAYHEPFAVGKNEIIKEFRIEEEDADDIINNLKRINAIDIKDGKFKLNFTVFLEKDIPLLDKYFRTSGEVIGNKIIDKKEEIYKKIHKISAFSNFSKERLLYHIICDKIFDGTAFEFFRERGIFIDSKIQPGNRDYMIFAYEDSKKVEEHSNILLCSSNNYRNENFKFNSFGDSNGERKDIYRYFKKAVKALQDITTSKKLNIAYIKLIEDKNREISQKCGNLIWKVYKNELRYDDLSLQEKELVDFLVELEYLSLDNNTISCIVPVFESQDGEVIAEISNIVLNDICDTVKNELYEFKKDAVKLTAIKHQIPMEEIAIELWHQIFGFVNEYLAQKGFVQAPKYKEGEGRYLRSLTITLEKTVTCSALK